MNSDDVAVLDPEVVANHSVDASTAIIEVVISQNDQNSVLSLLALDEHCVATEELEGLHSVVRQGNDGVVIVGRICDAAKACQNSLSIDLIDVAYMREFGFFFFFRMAVDVSSSSRFSAPEASLRSCQYGVIIKLSVRLHTSG
jgi:hypothetical protein